MIHVVDDDEAVRNSLALLIGALGCKCRTFGSAASFLDEVTRNRPDLLILDLNMPQMNGADLYASLVRRGFDFPVVLLTAQPDAPIVCALKKAGIKAVLGKPMSVDTLEAIVNAFGRKTAGGGPAVYVSASDDGTHRTIATLVEGLGWKAQIFDKAADCLDAVSRDAPDCFICDLDQTQGACLAQALIEKPLDIPCVAITDTPGSAICKRTAFVGSFTGRWEVSGRRDLRRLRSAIVESLLSWLRFPSPRLLAPVLEAIPPMDEDFRESLKTQVSNDLVLTPDFHVAAMSDRYASSTMLDPDGHIGQYMFDVFPDNPDDSEATGVANLNGSLSRACTSRSPDRMALQRYDVRTLDGAGPFEERWWYPVNFPVVRNGKLQYVVHRVDDVTRFVHLQRNHQAAAVMA